MPRCAEDGRRRRVRDLRALVRLLVQLLRPEDDDQHRQRDENQEQEEVDPLGPPARSLLGRRSERLAVVAFLCGGEAPVGCTGGDVAGRLC